VDDGTLAAVGRWVAKSREDMETVTVMVKMDHPRAAISESYFAAFHASLAALLGCGVRPSKRSNVSAVFDTHLVKPGLIEPEYAGILARLGAEREKADYRPELCDVSDDVVDPLIADAGRFVARMERYLREVGAIE